MNSKKTVPFFITKQHPGTVPNKPYPESEMSVSSNSDDGSESEIPFLYNSNENYSLQGIRRNNKTTKPLLSKKSPSRKYISRLRRSGALQIIIMAILIGSVCFSVGLLLPRKILLFGYSNTTSLIYGPPTTVNAAGDALVKPLGLKVVGFVFFGRRKYVDILDCYLRRNLAINGGWLDKIIFITDTTRTAKDKDWIHNMVTESALQGYYEIVNQNSSKTPTWSQLWGLYLNEPDTIYVKIDDDIVFIDDNAIPRIVSTLIANPTAHNIQANLVNCHQTEWFHLRTGAVLPFLPEIKNVSQEKSTKLLHQGAPTWRHSEMPIWSGNNGLKDSFHWTNTWLHKEWQGPLKKNRWLPLEATPENLKHTPIWQASSPDNLVYTYSYWGIAAQQHYSLFYHLEKNTLENYYWGNVQGIWNPWYKHYDINLMAIYGKTALETAWWEWPPVHSDQWAVTEGAPEVINRPWLIDTHAIAAHYAFSTQETTLLRTDILDRYRAYANEKVCSPKNQKASFEDDY